MWETHCLVSSLQYLFIIKQQNLLTLMYNILFDFNVDGYLIFESFQCIFKKRFKSAILCKRCDVYLQYGLQCIATMLILLLTGRLSDSWNTWGRFAETSGSWKGNSEGGLHGWAEF